MRRASLRAAARVGRKRRSVTSVPEEWPSPLPGGMPEGGTEPGLHAVWRPIHGGRFGGSSRDKCCFRGTTVWIAEFTVACRSRPRSVADCVVDTQSFRGRDPGEELKRGSARRRATLMGEGAGDPIGSPVPFLAFYCR